MTVTEIGRLIGEGHGVLGIELGSTRIKGVLVGPDHAPIATGVHEWENQYVDGMWTYALDAVQDGVRACYAALAEDVRRRHGVELRTVGGLGISAMMHGYLAFDAAGELLTPFRTWRNTNTGEAAARLTAEFGHNVPHRWSIAHLYQAILDGEPHVGSSARLTTLAGYVHWQLTGRHVLGVGDASGMFPVDPKTGTYDKDMVATFERLAAVQGVSLSLRDLLPAVQVAGTDAGRLTDAGATWLDPTGTLRSGAPICPPEGDAGTGMVATNSVAPRTGNVSAGTSIFAMVVLERPLERVHPELDIVTTPAGDPVAMVHCNNGASELNAWVGLFAEFAVALGLPPDHDRFFDLLLRSALDGEPDGGGLMAYNYLSGEPITGVESGRPLVVRSPDSRLELATFMRTLLLSALATLRIGLDVLQRDERVGIDRMFAHGGLFRTKGVAQALLAAALDTPITAGELAGEGGAWGMAILASYAATQPVGRPLERFLDEQVFAEGSQETIAPAPTDVAGFNRFLERYVQLLPVERAAAVI